MSDPNKYFHILKNRPQIHFVISQKSISVISYFTNFSPFCLFFSITAVKLEGQVFLPFVQPYLLLRKLQMLKDFWHSALLFTPTFFMLYFLSRPPDIALQLSILWLKSREKFSVTSHKINSGFHILPLPGTKPKMFPSLKAVNHSVSVHLMLYQVSNYVQPISP